ncbi:hypothetical protein PENARI_c063G06307 [Penicillium arizonense]|uniref:Uncharacterized protein n=1 Tax=Penicillium arizonense TaxID=1835702 RepID=A0A1F5L279_PENAI|nr:hypothetical protein PENARI_c063G06307 [Penicillium arizonense]OGE47100.1 hypothetical protein PENARI_c063G06307 [Penicillium arizonense]
MAAWLLACNVFLETVDTSRNAFTRTALVAVDRGDHALANRLDTAVGSIVNKRWVKFWVAYGISKNGFGVPGSWKPEILQLRLNIVVKALMLPWDCYAPQRSDGLHF